MSAGRVQAGDSEKFYSFQQHGTCWGSRYILACSVENWRQWYRLVFSATSCRTLRMELKLEHPARTHTPHIQQSGLDGEKFFPKLCSHRELDGIFRSIFLKLDKVSLDRKLPLLGVTARSSSARDNLPVGWLVGLPVGVMFLWHFDLDSISQVKQPASLYDIIVSSGVQFGSYFCYLLSPTIWSCFKWASEFASVCGCHYVVWEVMCCTKSELVP